jgi:hypothetical protein
VDICQITKFDPIGLPYHREGHCWNSRWYAWSEAIWTHAWDSGRKMSERGWSMLFKRIFFFFTMPLKKKNQSRLPSDFFSYRLHSFFLTSYKTSLIVLFFFSSLGAADQ